MKNTIKIATVISAVIVSSNALGVAGLDRLVFNPSLLFEKGNYAELTLARANPKVSPTALPSANVGERVNTLKFAYKHQISDKFGLGVIVNTQPVGVDINYKSVPGLDFLRGSVSAKSYIALGHYKATERISAFGGINHQRQKGNADLGSGALTFEEDSDTGFIVGGAYSIPKIALRVSLSYESDLEFSHTTVGFVPNSPNTTSATPKSLTLDFQSGVAKDTLVFGSIRRSKWSDSQVKFLGTQQLSLFDDTTVYKLGVGRKINDSFSASVTLNYEKSSGKLSSSFSPQDGEKGIAIGGKYTAKSGLITSLGVQYRKLGDTKTIPPTSLDFSDNDVVTVGLKLAKSF